MNNYDIGIIGAGVAGAFATLKIAKENKDLKTIVFDIGRPPSKRRRQLEGWLGCLPNSDGKFYLSDLDKVSELTGLRKAKSSLTYFNNLISEIDNFKTVVDKGPQVSVQKKLKKIGYDFLLNDYIQFYPKDIHALSKILVSSIEENKNITFNFDNEVKKIYKQKNMFVISCESQEYKCKKIILATGRSGWRWCKELYESFGLIENNDYSKFGIRVEASTCLMKDFNKSTCTIKKGNDIEIGPLSWYGTVIPEDHLDVAISSFRSNENRWKTDKVSFSLIGNIPFENAGFEQTDRLSKLTFLLANDRIIREKITTFMNNKSKISIIPEYEWLKNTLNELSNVMPEVISKGYFHVPTITPFVPKIKIKQNLETDLDGMFVAGENSGTHGLLSAAVTGIMAADFITKG